MRVVLKESWLGLRNSTTRIPFRYGNACLTRCPQAVLMAVVEVGGKVVRGFAGDCLPPGWFDKSPDKNFAAQIDDMIAVIKAAEKTFAEEFASPVEFFPAWLIAYERVQRRAAEWGMTPLVASFGISLLERAIIDAMARAAGKSFCAAMRENLYAIAPGFVHQQLAGLAPCDWLPREPRQSVWVRHTVGLGDPLTAADIPANERLDDGYPQALEQYITRTGTRYFKIKVSNHLEHDLQRLATFAALVERHLGNDYRVTLDGNEQYDRAEDFDLLMESMRAAPVLQTLLQNTLAIEQPLARHIALDAGHTAGIRALCQWRPVIIDESDGTLDSYAQALELGYRGVSSKNCKGTVKSILNAGLTWLANDRGAKADYLMTGEDLCSVGIIPVQADLCLAATLGLEHVERNGHHYHPGLSYLPKSQQQAALAAHGDFYRESGSVIRPHVEQGRFHIESLHCRGFGFAVEPDLSAYTFADDWQFQSLGLDR